MKHISFLMAVAFGISSMGCQKFLDVNKDPNNPIDVQESLLLPPIEQNISDNIQGQDIANTNAQNYIQNVAPNQPNPGIWNYQSFNNEFDGDWNAFYVTCLNNLRILNTKAETNGNLNYAAIAKILTAYTLGTATDFWNDIPYSRAFGEANFLVSYDSQESIYDTVQALLTRAITNIDANNGVKPGGDDFFYSGDMQKWRKAAWSLKARYAIHLTKAPGHTAVQQADEALSYLQNAMTSNDDDLKFSYSGASGAENIWNSIFSPVSTWVLNETLVDTLVNRNDPRLPVIVKPAANTGLYHGRRIGSPIEPLGDYSYPGNFFMGKASSNYIMTFGECLFIKAEATLIKSGYSAAQTIFEEAIKSNFAKLGIAPESSAATSFITDRQLSASNALQRIIEEKAVANIFNIETYNDWRRTGFPNVAPVDGALSQIPRRMLYPQSEIITNPQPQQSAKLTDRVWWDVQ